MDQPAIKNKNTRNLKIALSALLITAFFIPWVSWNKINVTGADVPLGNFFQLSEDNFHLGHPFPEYSFTSNLLWLIPALAIITLLTAFLNKKYTFIPVITGILTLGTVMVYILFSNTLTDLGATYSLKAGLYLSLLAAVGTILITSVRTWQKIVYVIAGPLTAWLGFTLASGYIMSQEFNNTSNVKADYTVDATDMIKEFQENDSLANNKYREKIVVVKGNISAIEKPTDSTTNIKFIDTVSGSYIIFPFEKETLRQLESLKTEDHVLLKGSCSGAVYSEILGAYFISFKRSVLNK